MTGGGPTRKAALEAIRLFRWSYAEALEAWRGADRDVIFPAGTWQMREVHRAQRHPPPGGLAVLTGFRAPPPELHTA